MRVGYAAVVEAREKHRASQAALAEASLLRDPVGYVALLRAERAAAAEHRDAAALWIRMTSDLRGAPWPN